MAEPIIIVKEGSLTVQVLERNSITGKETRLLRVTVPGKFKGALRAAPRVQKRVLKSGNSWKITWK